MPHRQQTINPRWYSLAHLPAETQQQLWEQDIPDRCLEVSSIQWRTAPGGKQQGTMVIREPHLGPCAYKLGPETRGMTSNRGISVKVTNNRRANERMWFYPGRDIITFDSDLLGRLLTNHDLSVDDFDKVRHIGLAWGDITQLPSTRTDVEDVPRLWYNDVQRLKELMPALETINFFVPHGFLVDFDPASLAAEPETEYEIRFPCMITPLDGDVLIGLAQGDADEEAGEERDGLFDAIIQNEDERLMRELVWEDLEVRLRDLNKSAAWQFGVGPAARAAAALQFRAWVRERNTLQRGG